ncbi:MAG: hypothetical protein NVS3B12_07400 [Acidimicrobiales bacterium]
MSARLEKAREAFAAIERKNWEVPLAVCQENYKHHLVPLGIEVTGRQGFRDTLIPLIDTIGLEQKLIDAIEHGDFILATVEAKSTAADGTSTIAYILRYEGDQIAEIWAISTPERSQQVKAAL